VRLSDQGGVESCEGSRSTARQTPANHNCRRLTSPCSWSRAVTNAISEAAWLRVAQSAFCIASVREQLSRIMILSQRFMNRVVTVSVPLAKVLRGKLP
jgi:hypothetical protein